MSCATTVNMTMMLTKKGTKLAIWVQLLIKPSYSWTETGCSYSHRQRHSEGPDISRLVGLEVEHRE